MPDISLTDEEHALLRELLEENYTDLRTEIVDTDSSMFKQGLKAREHVLEGIIAKLGGLSGS